MRPHVRETIYKVIDRERDYQDSLNHTKTDGCAKTVGDYILLLEEYVAEARAGWVRNAGTTVALHSVRKCAAIAVRTMEEHGWPER